MNTAPARQVQCARCRAGFCIPSITPELRAKAAALVRADHRAEATRVLKVSGGVDLVNGKGIVLHITPAKDICHRCRKPIPPDEESVCENCRALNLNW